MAQAIGAESNHGTDQRVSLQIVDARICGFTSISRLMDVTDTISRRYGRYPGLSRPRAVSNAAGATARYAPSMRAEDQRAGPVTVAARISVSPYECSQTARELQVRPRSTSAGDLLALGDYQRAISGKALVAGPCRESTSRLSGSL